MLTEAMVLTVWPLETVGFNPILPLANQATLCQCPITMTMYMWESVREKVEFWLVVLVHGIVSAALGLW